MQNIKFVTNEEDIMWTPVGMTSADALVQLPQILLLALGEMPCDETTRRLEQLRFKFAKEECYELVILATRCIETASQMRRPN